MRPTECNQLRAPQAAEYLSVSESTLAKLRLRGNGPRYSRPLGTRLIIYSQVDLDAWVEGGKRRSTSEKT